jgi:hypothetical protein
MLSLFGAVGRKGTVLLSAARASGTAKRLVLGIGDSPGSPGASLTLNLAGGATTGRENRA